MTLFPKAPQGRGGGGGRGAASSPAVARKTTPRQSKQQGAGSRSSPRLHLTRKRTQTVARRGAGIGARVASTHQQSSRARAGSSATIGARRPGNAASRGRDDVGGRTRTKKAVQVDGVAEVVKGLKVELGTAMEATIEKTEAGCDAFVAAALERFSSAMSDREEEVEMAEATLLKMESREASVTSACSGTLKAIESNQASLSALVARCRANLDGIQQTETRKLKSSLDRAMGVKS